MTSQLLRHILALPAPLIRGQNATHPPTVVEPYKRQLNLSHPTGWLATNDNLQTYTCTAGQVHFCRDGSTAFAVGVEGARVELLGSWADAMRRQNCRRTLLFPLANWQVEPLRDEGFDLMQVGEEAEVYLPAYHLRGGRYANLRQMLRRARRNQLMVSLDDRLPRDAKQLESVWLNGCTQKRRMRLLVGEHDACKDATFAVVRNAQSQPLAWVESRPGFTGRGYGIDSMIRHPSAPAGAVELAVHALLSQRQRQGDVWFSLGAVPLRGVDYSRPLLGLICNILRETSLGNQLFSFSGLGQFKGKFAPQWRPIMIADHGRLNAFSLYEGCRLWGLF